MREARYQSDLRLVQDKYDDLRTAIMSVPPAERLTTVMKRFSGGMLRNLVRHLLSYDITELHGRQMDVFDHELLAEMVVDRWAPISKSWKDLRRDDIFDEDNEAAIAAHSVERNEYIKQTGVDTKYQVLGPDGKLRHSEQAPKPKTVLRLRERDAVRRELQISGVTRNEEARELRQ